MNDKTPVMIAYNDCEKALPKEKLLALFQSVGWTTEEGEAAHLHHFNVPFYEKFGFTVTAVGADCVFLRRECPLFG